MPFTAAITQCVLDALANPLFGNDNVKPWEGVGWGLAARVAINEPGRFQVGWVQVLRSEWQRAFYDDGTAVRCFTRRIAGVPVRDGEHVPPWYDEQESMKEVSVAHGELKHIENLKMEDYPDDDWPLVRSDRPLSLIDAWFVYQTTLVVREVGGPPRTFKALLAQYDFHIKGRWVFPDGDWTGRGLLSAHPQETERCRWVAAATRVVIQAKNIRTPNACVWSARRANDPAGFVETPIVTQVPENYPAKTPRVFVAAAPAADVAAAPILIEPPFLSQLMNNDKT